MTAAGPKRRALGGLTLVALCFAASALLRIGEIGTALAEELQAVPGEESRPAAPQTPSENPDALLAAIQERERQLQLDAERLAERQQALKVAEEKLAEQLAAFETARAGLEETLALADGAAERDIAQMTTVYENMKPEDAARIFEKMDVSFASGLLVRMRPDLAAEVLSGMSPDAAYALTVMISSRNARAPTE